MAGNATAKRRGGRGTSAVEERRRLRESAPATSTSTDEHKHYWVLETPNGPVSRGTCRECGTTREFPNSSEDSIWDAAEGRSRWNDMGISRRKKKSGPDPIETENVVS